MRWYPPAHGFAVAALALTGCFQTNVSGTSFPLDDGGAAASGGGAGASPGGGGTAGTPGAGGTGGATMPSGMIQDAGFTFHVPDGGGAGGPDAAPSASCGMLMATMRDFKDDHPDMEKTIETVKGLVKAELGADDKPVYAPMGATAVTAGAASFDQWYRDVPGVNMKFTIPLPLAQTSPGNFAYSNAAFFPLDDRGFGNQGRNHNFHFTTEIHATFKYRGGERFTFTGDDDVFVFVNKKLAIDLGGVHPPQSATIDFDAQRAALGLTVGGVYSFDAFHAERHTVQSNFRIETSIDCLETIIK
jgi:fibro-slime domain-containing protein